MSQFLSQSAKYFSDFVVYLGRLIGHSSVPKMDFSWIVAIFFIVVIFLIGLSLGKTRMLLALLSVYIAAFLEPHFIYFQNLRQSFKGQPEYLLHLAIFMFFYLLAFFVMNRSLLKTRLTLSESSFVAVVLMSVIEIGFLLSRVIIYLPAKSIPVSSGIIEFFGTKNAQFWWALAPLAVLLLFGHKKDGQNMGS